jgi:hypothetical protein
VLASKEAFQGLIKILQNVPAIRNLHRVGRAIRDGFGISERPIPSGDFDSRMGFEPLGESLRLTVRQ